MNVLVACERSGKVREAFRRMGHVAWSCDLEPCDDGMDHHHIRGDVRGVLAHSWDLVIAFPPCTHLSVSGAHRWAEKRKSGEQQKAIEFFLQFTRLPSRVRVAIENPVGIMSTVYRKPDQIIQPWQFGHAESKRTCLWLIGLPKLVPTLIVDPPRIVDGKPRWHNQTDSGQNRLGPSPDRARRRSETYFGVAQAMAEQWGCGDNWWRNKP